jgi:hypothetical protein
MEHSWQSCGYASPSTLALYAVTTAVETVGGRSTPSTDISPNGYCNTCPTALLLVECVGYEVLTILVVSLVLALGGRVGAAVGAAVGEDVG